MLVLLLSRKQFPPLFIALLLLELFILPVISSLVSLLIVNTDPACKTTVKPPLNHFIKVKVKLSV